MADLTDQQIADLTAERAAARLKRKELNRRRYVRHYQRVRALRAAGRAS